MKKKIISFLLLVASIVGTSVANETFIVNGLTYRPLTTSTCALAYNGHGYDGNITVPATVENNGMIYRVTQLDSKVFSDTYTLSLTLSEGLEIIGAEAFLGSYIETLILPSTIIEIGAKAFSECMMLSNFTMGNNVVTIGDEAFNACMSLTSFNVPASVTNIGVNPFSGTSISEFTVDDENTTFSAISGVLYTKNPCRLIAFPSEKRVVEFEPYYYTEIISAKAFKNIKSIKALTFNPFLTSIEEEAFASCNSLEQINFNTALENIGKSAFTRCNALTSLKLPKFVTTIGSAAFKGCSGLTTVKLNKNLMSIGANAFTDATAVTAIYSYNPIPPVLVDGNDIFSSDIYETTTLYIPGGCSSTYKAAPGFSSFVTIKEIEPGTPVPGQPIDLGLSVYWADVNVGATTPEDYGYFLSWGEINEKSKYAWESYDDYTDNQTLDLPENICGTQYDAAHVYWGEEWRMPTPDEFAELINNTNVSLETVNGVTGMRFASLKAPQNSIFIPFGGYYDKYSNDDINGSAYLWSGLASSKQEEAYSLAIQEEEVICSLVRYYGQNIRPVCPAPDNSKIFTIDGLTYRSIDDTTCELIAGETSYSGNINVPANVANNSKNYLVVGIGKHAFTDCTNLGIVSLPSKLIYIGEEAFSGSNIAELTLPHSVRQLRRGAFANATLLTTIIFGEQMERIEDEVFYGCTALTNLILNDHLQYIGSSAFAYCTSLEELNLGSMVGIVGNDVVYKAHNLKRINVDDNNPFITDIEGVLLTYDQQALMAYPANHGRSYSIPPLVNTIKATAFHGVTNLETVILPEALENIGIQAFMDCTNLRNINFPQKLITIWDQAFENCVNIESVTIPNETYGMKSRAFYGCANLTYVELGTGITRLETEAFGACPLIKEVQSKKTIAPAVHDGDESTLIFDTEVYQHAQLYVPQEAVNSYRTANGWKQFSHIIGDESSLKDVFMSTTLDISINRGSLLVNGGEPMNAWAAYDLTGCRVNVFVEGKIYLVLIGGKTYKILAK